MVGVVRTAAPIIVWRMLDVLGCDPTSDEDMIELACSATNRRYRTGRLPRPRSRPVTTHLSSSFDAVGARPYSRRHARLGSGAACSKQFNVVGLEKLGGNGILKFPSDGCNAEHEIAAMLTGFPPQMSSLEASIEVLGDQVAVLGADIECSVNRSPRSAEVTAGLERLEEQVTDGTDLMRRLLKVMEPEVGDCPRLFTLQTKRASISDVFRPDRTPVELALWCEHPGHWHALAEATYLIRRPKAWLLAVAPYARIVLTALKVVAPIVAGGAAV